MKSIFLSAFLLFNYCNCEHLIGKWSIVKDKPRSIYHYPIIEFEKNSLLILHSYGDTIYTGKYLMKNNAIQFEIGNDKEEIEIIKCEKDTIILAGFRNIKDTIIYTKNK